MRSSGWEPNPIELVPVYPYKNRRDTGCTYEQRRVHLRTQQEVCVFCKPRTETSSSTLILNFQPPELWVNKFLFEPLSLVFCYKSPRKQYEVSSKRSKYMNCVSCYFGHTALIRYLSGNRSCISLWGSIFASILPSLSLSPSYLVKHLDSSKSHRDRLRNRTNAMKFPWQLLEESLVLLCQARTQKHLLWSCWLSMQNVNGTKAAEGRAGREKKKQKPLNIICALYPASLKPDLPLDFLDVSQKVSFCV